MNNLIHIFLILCFFFSNFACTTNTSDGGILFYREKYGEWDWHEDGDEFKESDCTCGLCKCITDIESRWESWTPTTAIEEIFQKHINNM